MGLLSDPEYGSVKWVRVLKRVQVPVCILLYVAALVWFIMLGNKEFNNETYFSENALLPGLVTNEFHAEQSAKQFYNEFLQELQDKYADTGEMPVPWLVAKMSQLHLEVYMHNFTLNYPMGQGQIYTGTNVYGILRAPRTSSLEALVVTAPYRDLGTHQKGTAAGIALMLAFAQFARPQKYWAKDIIFLVTEHEQLGMQAWLEAYHGLQSETESFYNSLGSFWKPSTLSYDFGKFMPKLPWDDYHKCLNPGTLKGRSGSIQAAINLEIHNPKIKYVEVKVEGLNGQLPNLDLVNLVHKLCVKSGIHHSYKYSYSWMRSRRAADDWLDSVYTMMGMVTAQIAGVPNGNHGLFHRFGIEAVTLEGRDANDPAGMPPKVTALSSANFHRLGLALESIFRSLNNLLERFHQSYFFYLLAATNRFISIGQYMPSLCLMCLAMMLRALNFWVTIQQNYTEDLADKEAEEETKKAQGGESNVPGEHEAKPLLKKEDGKESVRKRKVEPRVLEEQEAIVNKPKKDKKTKEVSRMSVVNIGGIYVTAHLLGYAVMNSPVLLSHFGAVYFDQHSEESVYYGLIAISVLLIFITPYIPAILRTGSMTFEEMTLINILLVAQLVTVCLTVGMHNFPLGLSIAVFYTPLALVARVAVKGQNRRVILFLKRAFCLLLHPLAVITIGMVLYSRVLFPEENILGMISRGTDAAMQATMFSIVDSLIYGNWLFNVMSAIILPMWLIFWQISCYQVDASVA